MGAAQGFLGQLLSDTGLEIDAVEPNPVWAEHAKPFYRNVHASTVEQANLPDATYGAVVCADVLEHVPDPHAVLMQLRRVARADALFVISLPNVAHLAVRLMLLFGKFPKMDRGILDRTHLHFFTKDTAIDLLQSGGLKIERVSATGVPLDEVWRGGQGTVLFKTFTKLQHLFIAAMPRLFAMQWVFTARPQSP